MRYRWLAVTALVVAAGAVNAGAAGATARFAVPAQAGPRIGDGALQLPPALRGKPAFSDPRVPGPAIRRPGTQSCKVTLIRDYPFENFTPATGAYAPPSACPGPWSKVILDWHVSVSGVQFDRLGAIWLGGTEIFHFTTSEPPGPSISWHVAKDVTEYANTFQTASDYTVSLGNVVNGTYTGIYDSTATLTFYQTGKGWPAAKVPDTVVPISEYPTGSPPWFTLNTPSNQASATVTLPTNIETAALEVYTSGHGCDEFWYAQESAAYEQSIGQTCGGGAYREIDVWIDGQPAGIVQPYPYLYTGAIDPILWLPITGHDTLDIPPYRVDLSPWVGILTNGTPHTIAVSVFNNFGYWVADADLLLSLDHGATSTKGALTHVALTPTQFERVDEKHLTPAGGRASYTARHELRAEGYVDTSHGRIYHHVQEQIVFADHQNFNNNTGTFAVTSKGVSQTELRQDRPGAAQSTTTVDTYPLALDLTSQVDISQGYYETIDSLVGRNPSESYLQDAITARTFSGKPTQTVDHYISTDSHGACFAQTLVASNGSLTGETKSPRCGH